MTVVKFEADGGAHRGSYVMQGASAVGGAGIGRACGSGMGGALVGRLVPASLTSPVPESKSKEIAVGGS